MQESLFDPRLTEHRNPRTADIDLANPLEIVDLINDEDRSVPDAVRAECEQIARAIEMVVDCFKRGGRLIYVGAGTSGRLGVLDATECPPTFGVEPEMVQGIIAGGYAALTRSQEGAEDHAEDGAAAVDDANVGPSDFVFGIATSSTTPYVRGALMQAVRRGARTGFLCCTEPGAEMRKLVDVCVVPLVGPEVIAGSTRMKAGTATKLVLNTLTTGAMIRLGKVYGNLMVDLRAMSEKLVDRGQRIVMAATGCSREEALQVISQAGGSVKRAIVMKHAGLSSELAELYLAESDEFVRRALELAEAVNASEDPYGYYPVVPPSEEIFEVVRAALRDLPERISELTVEVPDARLRERPAQDKWCAKEHIEHLIDCDALMTRRIEAILVQEGVPITDRDDEAENRKVFESGACEAAIEVLLSRLRASRSSLLAPLQALPAQGWSRTGAHERYGPISTYQILRHVIWHDHRHLEGIRRLISR